MGMKELKTSETTTTRSDLFAKLFATAVKEVVSIQGGIDVEVEESFIYNSKDCQAPIDIAAQLGFVTKEIKGNVLMGFPAQTFISLASTMLGKAYSSINQENMDLGAELLNMIFGTVKSKLKDEMGTWVLPTIPVVLEGQKVSYYVDIKEPVIVIPFSMGKGKFFVSVSISLNEEV